MTDTKVLNVNSCAAVRIAGLQAFKEVLGPVGMVRFLQQFDAGRGDYTREKDDAPDETIDELDAQLKLMDK